MFTSTADQRKWTWSEHVFTAPTWVLLSSELSPDLWAWGRLWFSWLSSSLSFTTSSGFKVNCCSSPFTSWFCWESSSFCPSLGKLPSFTDSSGISFCWLSPSSGLGANITIKKLSKRSFYSQNMEEKNLSVKKVPQTRFSTWILQYSSYRILTSKQISPIFFFHIRKMTHHQFKWVFHCFNF